MFALTLDVGHDCCLCGADRQVFERYPDKLRHMHLHDSDGKHAHLPLGEGVVNVREKLLMLGESDTCLLEVKTAKGALKSLDYIKHSKGA